MQTVTPPVPAIFGDGAPTDPAQNGVRYFDTTTSPYSEYVYFAGAWQGPLGGGGSGSTPNVYSYAPDGVIFGYGFAFAPTQQYGPYVYEYAGPGAADPSYSYGGYFKIAGGNGGNAPR